MSMEFTDVVLAVYALYVKNSRSATVKEIAEELGVAPSTVRRRIDHEPHGENRRRIAYDRVEIQIYSRDYPSMSTGYRTVDAYRPSIRFLIDKIKNLEEQIMEMDNDG